MIYQLGFSRVLDVFAKPFLWISELIKLDFPTLDLPINANSFLLSLGHSEDLELLFMNLTFFKNTLDIFAFKPIEKYFVEFLWVFHHRSMSTFVDPKYFRIWN